MLLYYLIVLVPVIFIIVLYNRLVRFKNMLKEAWAGVDVQLKKRYDLVPALVETVKGYARHEQKLLEELTQIRSNCLKDQTVKSQEGQEKNLGQSIARIMIVAENYPDLKASDNFLSLQRSLSEIENHIQLARRYYNGVVREYNILIERFPNNLLAGTMGHQRADFFEIESIEKLVPSLNFEKND